MGEEGAETGTIIARIAQMEKTLADLALSLDYDYFPRDLRGRVGREKKRLDLLLRRILDAKRDRILVENRLR